jgi:hypothetical protein
MEYPILTQALELFGETESPLNRATRQFGQREATSQTILNETRGRKLWNNRDQAQDSNVMTRFFGRSITG